MYHHRSSLHSTCCYLDHPPPIVMYAPLRHSLHHVYKLDHSPHLVTYALPLSTPRVQAGPPPRIVTVLTSPPLFT
ncbi:hypothetical protein Pcinc_001405 [Petrolisthes cinctipes]|uniref:Uncharacterized protein n=1 Tax=Petrolisthes cinctipes TaxID=88211 RepID=A0AAE1GMW5_PETCI|nr:hypothetical protein Pcinc_001405 [Petrolisthes cinctipes]